MSVEAQPAYVLHLRHYQDSNALVDFLTRDYGRVRGVVRGLYGKQKGAQRQRGILLPAVPLLIGWRGRSELKTVHTVESAGHSTWLQGERLFSLLYSNELLTRLLPLSDNHPDLFQHYSQLVLLLASGQEIEPLLREFELGLLDALGYAIDLSAETLNQRPVQPGLLYRFSPQCLQVENAVLPKQQEQLFMGRDLLAIASRDFSEPAVRQAAKRLLRQWLRYYLGDKPLQSRQLFAKPQSRNDKE